MIEFKDVKYQYIKNRPVLSGVSFSVDNNTFATLLGAGNAGKTTLSKLICREIKRFNGDILINGESIKRAKIKDLNVLYLSDEYLLSNNKTIRQNAAYGLFLRRYPYNTIPELTDKALSVCGLLQYSEIKVKDLTENDKFLTALARGIARNPDIIILDDPFRRLPLNSRIDSTIKVLPLIKSLNSTVIFITKDLEIAEVISGRIVVLNDGVISYDGDYNQSRYAKENWREE